MTHSGNGGSTKDNAGAERPARPRFPPKRLRVRVPSEHVDVCLATLDGIHKKLVVRFSIARFRTLGELDGRSVRDIVLACRLGARRAEELVDILTRHQAIVADVPWADVAFDVPEFGRDFRLDEVRLRPWTRTMLHRSQKVVLEGGTLVQIHEKTPRELQLTATAAKDLEEAIYDIRCRGPKYSKTLFVTIDTSLLYLDSRETEVLLVHFGGTDEKPCTLKALAVDLGTSAEAARQRVQRAITHLREVGGPEFGNKLRELAAHGGIEEGDIIEGTGGRHPREFYTRLLIRLLADRRLRA